MDGARRSLLRIACKFKAGLFMAYVFTGNKPFVKKFLALGDIGSEKLSSRFETLTNCKLDIGEDHTLTDVLILHRRFNNVIVRIIRLRRHIVLQISPNLCRIIPLPTRVIMFHFCTGPRKQTFVKGGNKGMVLTRRKQCSITEMLLGTVTVELAIWKGFESG